MNCVKCQTDKPIYIHTCLGCAVRLVKSARPSRKKQEMMILYISHYGKFSRDTILEALKNDTANATSAKLS